ncbi:HINT domain-containing protein, partial [Saccharothrix sp. MB29]|nr:HINT domain-containing protein [Saccharothrix sp. MB29]
KKAEGVGETCPTGRRHSFPAGTRVLLTDGTSKRIELFAPGDVVHTTDTATGRSGDGQVTRTIRTDHDKNYVDLTVRGADEHKHTITTTENHPFWSITRGRWVDAGRLERGEALRTASGAEVRLDGVRPHRTGQRTYDLTVNGAHTYYVLAGEVSLLVHNCGTNPDNRSGMDFTDAGRQEVYDANAAKNGGQLKCEYCGRDVVRRPR